ncbi:MAG: NRDE family protein [Acidobacteriia bacterium]|nr:NRDE family protein [Terriglobia bacterium]
MCILLALSRDSGGGELWIAANRDEHLDRPWQPPRVLVEAPLVFGGRDLAGGGTWLAANLDAGFVVGVTNARLGAELRERSRGRLVLDIASERSLPDALALLAEIEWPRYGEFNLLLGDPDMTWLATNDPVPTIQRAERPVVALGNDPLAKPGERVRAAAERAGSMAGLAGEALAGTLQALLADHDGVDPLCRHGERYGTVCSTVLTLSGRKVASYLFAPGRPCSTPFQTVVLPVA